uniref:Zinc-binding protein A33-like n=1 Tax=Sinocyclocheilus anshuiensis TaxID=1608454 RepID=A0A671S854_9TELE
MSSLSQISEEDLLCPVCYEIFTDPVLLLCSHSVCRACLKEFWSARGFQECPVCRKRFTGCQTPANLALRNVCESFLQKRGSSEVFCDVHGEKLKLFCLDDNHPVCLVCRDSEKHLHHTFRPVDEVAPLLKVNCIKPASHAGIQQTSNQHPMLGTSKPVTSIPCWGPACKTYLMLMTSNAGFFSRVDTFLVPAVQTRQKPGTSANSSRNYFLQCETPVTLDPNTAHPLLFLTDDLTHVKSSADGQQYPDNPERFDYYHCVLGSEGLNSGTHFWDVEVQNNTCWSVGVTTASNQRKGGIFFETGVWRVRYMAGQYTSQSPFKPRMHLTVDKRLKVIRVQLDWDGGKISFSDPLTNTHLCTFTSTFKEAIYPSFVTLCCSGFR